MSLPISDGVTERLAQFLNEVGKHLWDSRQRASFAMYMLGLLSSLPRKSVEPISALFATDPDEADAVYQRLLHFLGSAPWPDADVRLSATHFALAELTQKAPIESLIIDDTSFAKSGSDSVGVQRQYCGALGKLPTVRWSFRSPQRRDGRTFPSICSCIFRTRGPTPKRCARRRIFPRT